jgi:hypothetical protein
MEEVTMKFFKAFDGKMFETEDMCRIYEDSSNGYYKALISAANLIKTFCDERSCADCPFCISYEDLTCKLSDNSTGSPVRPWEWEV